MWISKLIIKVLKTDFRIYLRIYLNYVFSIKQAGKVFLFEFGGYYLEHPELEQNSKEAKNQTLTKRWNTNTTEANEQLYMKVTNTFLG